MSGAWLFEEILSVSIPHLPVDTGYHHGICAQNEWPPIPMEDQTDSVLSDVALDGFGHVRCWITESVLSSIAAII